MRLRDRLKNRRQQTEQIVQAFDEGAGQAGGAVALPGSGENYDE